MLLTDKVEGKAKIIDVDDIDTDNIFHASLLTIHDPQEIKKHIFGNLPEYEKFSKDDHNGEFLVVGRNFGKGSTRQQAVTGFLAHGIKIIIGKSFAPIYYTNAINEGLLLIQAPNIEELTLENGEKMVLDIKNSVLMQTSTGKTLKVEKVPQPVID
ncbi:MAG: hypothetical protein ACW967_08080, partial [Candidatus Hodarchaeales archaeon]